MKSGVRSFRPPRGFRVLIFGAAVAATLAISVVPSIPAGAPSINDKLGHTLVYGVNGVLAAVAFPSAAGLGWALAGLFAMGGGLELLQIALPRREGSWLDAGANTLGLVAGGVLFLRRRRAESEPA